jgi:hypothetical protein
VKGEVTGFGSETPPTPLLVWFLRGVAYLVVGTGVAAWARGMLDDPTARRPIWVLVGLGLAAVVAGAALMLYAVVAGLLRGRR